MKTRKLYQIRTTKPGHTRRCLGLSRLMTSGAAAFVLSGCSTLTAALPDTVAPELEHMSHVTQHAPFTASPTHYGADIVNLTAEWTPMSRIYVDVSEGVALNRTYSPGGIVVGEIYGPREQFTARIGYKFKVKP